MGFGEINIQDGNLNAETQQKQVEDFITQKYDAILIDPVNSAGIVPPLSKQALPASPFSLLTAELTTKIWSPMWRGIMRKPAC